MKISLNEKEQIALIDFGNGNEKMLSFERLQQFGVININKLKSLNSFSGIDTQQRYIDDSYEIQKELATEYYEDSNKLSYAVEWLRKTINNNIRDIRGYSPENKGVLEIERVTNLIKNMKQLQNVIVYDNEDYVHKII